MRSGVADAVKANLAVEWMSRGATYAAGQPWNYRVLVYCVFRSSLSVAVQPEGWKHSPIIVGIPR
jgi:hypothetical protein